jgi:Ran-binding protein 1
MASLTEPEVAAEEVAAAAAPAAAPVFGAGTASVGFGAAAAAAPSGFAALATPSGFGTLSAAAPSDGEAAATAEASGISEKAAGIEGAGEEDSSAVFEALVKLEEVETKSGEEEEACVFKMRAKLFVFGETLLDKGTGNKSWRERGIGEAKLLKHNEFGKIRLLMRQEKTMKVIVNHVVDPRITLEPNAGSDRSWVWSAFDFSDGELVETVFAMRFSNSECAGEFKEEFVKAQEVMKAQLAGEDSADTEKGDEAAEALAGLSTKTEE